jgi:hypothetical protein
MYRGLSIFIFSIITAVLFKVIQVYFGIVNGFHPDSLFYIDNSASYTAAGLFSISTLNNLYYFIVEWLGANEIALIFLNQVAFALTNVLIAHQFGYDFKTATLIKIFILFLPYRLHLSAHVLKDSLIILAVFATVTLPLSRVAPVFLFTSGMRIVAGPAALLMRFFPRRKLFFLGFVAVFLIALLVSPTVLTVLSERGDVDMSGRDFFAVPLGNATSVALISLKALFWPFLAKTGGYLIFAINPFALALAVEPLIFAAWAALNRQFITYLTLNGTLVAVMFCVLVTNYGAYYRYIYAFMILDYLAILMNVGKQRFASR